MTETQIRVALTVWLMQTGQKGHATQMDAVSYCVGYFGEVKAAHLDAIRGLCYEEGWLRV